MRRRACSGRSCMPIGEKKPRRRTGGLVGGGVSETLSLAGNAAHQTVQVGTLLVALALQTTPYEEISERTGW